MRECLQNVTFEDFYRQNLCYSRYITKKQRSLRLTDGEDSKGIHRLLKKASFILHKTLPKDGQ